jgi:tight adherence protein C
MHHELDLFAATPDLLHLRLVASGTIGAGIGVFVWWVLRSLATDDLKQGDEWRYDINRINELRRCDFLYRSFQPVIQALSRMNRNMFSESLLPIQREIGASGMSRFWLAEEYLGKLQLISMLLFPLYLWFFIQYFAMAGILFALGGVLVTVWILRLRLANRARYRVVLIKRRMPFLLDLLTLLMEAGTTFLQALGQGVKEFEGHPVSIEYGRVLADMNMGKTRTEAFRSMQSRLADDEIDSIIAAIIQGEELGSPLAQVFRIQSDVLRIKRTQRGEKLAAEAGVNMLLPGVLIMIATVLVILGPFVINVMRSGFIF